MSNPEEQPDLRLPETSQENIEPEIIVAESIAALRLKIEHKIISDQIPPDQWTNIVEAELVEKPNLQSYHDMILHYVEIRLFFQEKLEKIWNEAENQQSKPNHKDKVELTEESDPIHQEAEFANLVAGIWAQESNRKIWEKIQAGDVSFTKVIKGNQAFVFFMDDASYEKLGYESAGQMYAGQIPAVFISESTDESTTKHELQHVQNHIMKIFSQQPNFVKGEWIPHTKESSKFVDRKTEYEDSIRDKISDEILAMATKFSQFNFIEQGNKINDVEARLLFFENILGFASQRLSQVIKDVYLDTYLMEKRKSEVKDRVYYENLINESCSSLFRLIKDYISKYGNDGMSMAIDVLQQFRPEKWPAVVRLIETKAAK